MLKPDQPIDFKVLFDALPMPLVVLNVDLKIVEMNGAYLAVTKRTREDLLGRYIFDAFPAEGESRQRMQASFERARDGGMTDILPLVPYAIPVGGTFEERYWSCTHVPIHNAQGEVTFVVQNAQGRVRTEGFEDHSAASAGPPRKPRSKAKCCGGSNPCRP